jgi:NAD(P)-dependent dehydrogenase (short-subunit alcohol dehydrogenase family)
MTKECLPGMVANNHGHIINISSMSAFIPPAGLADYSASKAGLIAFHEVYMLLLPITFGTQTKEYALGVGARTHLSL